MKNNSTLALLFIAATCCSTPSAQAQLQTQYLLGASVGYALQNGDFTTELNYINIGLPFGAFHTHVNSLLEDSGFLWGGLIGAQIRCEDWLLGLELNLEDRKLESTFLQTFSDSVGFAAVSQGWLGQAKYSAGAAVGLSLRWGYQMAEYILPYIRLGVETSEDKFTENYAGVNGYAFTLTNAAKKRLYRVFGGVGFEVPLLDSNLTVRAEYNFHAEGKNLNAQGLIIDGVRDPYFINVASANHHTFKASLVLNIG